jgi:hypothetical protein
MTKEEINRLTFEIILRRATIGNSVRLMQRAQLAYHLAKIVKGRSRTKALASRGGVEIRPDPSLPEFVVVTALGGTSLHMPSLTLREGLTDDL